jgi:hypothetical protein
MWPVGQITRAIGGQAWHNGHPLDRTMTTVRWEAQQLATALGAGDHAGEPGGDVHGKQQVEGGRAGWDQPGHLPLAREMEGHL